MEEGEGEFILFLRIFIFNYISYDFIFYFYSLSFSIGSHFYLYFSFSFVDGLLLIIKINPFEAQVIDKGLFFIHFIFLLLFCLLSSPQHITSHVAFTIEKRTRTDVMSDGDGFYFYLFYFYFSFPLSYLFRPFVHYLFFKGRKKN